MYAHGEPKYGVKASAIRAASGHTRGSRGLSVSPQAIAVSASRPLSSSSAASRAAGAPSLTAASSAAS